MPNVKLKNVSERKFTLGEKGDLMPGQSMMIGQAEAQNLIALYPGELVDVVAEAAIEASNPAPAPAPVVDAIEAMTVVKLREALKEKGVAFKPAASKAELVALLKGADAPAPVASPAAPTVAPTDLPEDPAELLVEGTVYQDTNGALFVGAKKPDGVIGLLPVDQLTEEEKAPLVAEGKLAA